MIEILSVPYMGSSSSEPHMMAWISPRSYPWLETPVQTVSSSSLSVEITRKHLLCNNGNFTKPWVIRAIQKSFAFTKHSSHPQHSEYTSPHDNTIIASNKANSNKDKFGNWKLTGPAAVLVTKSSATHCRPWEDGAENICAIHRTHSEMVKFGPHDSDYYDVRERLKGLSRRAFTARHRLQTSRAICMS